MSARLIQVIETTLERRGDGKETPIRIIRQYWSEDGELLAESDPLIQTFPAKLPQFAMDGTCFICGGQHEGLQCPQVAPTSGEQK